jgi:N-acetylmuramoyl-L-alanine amidase
VSGTLVVGTLPRISPERFRAVLEQAGSPAAGEAEACWRAVAREGVDPLFALAVFRHESRYGTAGLVPQYGLRNPGATRTSRTGVGEPVQIPGRGQFWRYPSWAEGFRDLAYRLVDPTFVYRQRGLDTVGEIIPVWAPASDGNVPEAYIRAVEATMKELAQEQIPVLPYRIALIPEGNVNRPGIPMRPEWVTVHETANTRPGANAEMHRRFVHGGGGAEGVSFHLVVDDREVIQLLRFDEVAWHAGDGRDGPGNRTSIAIETCVNSDGDWGRTLRNLVILLASICRAYGWGADRIVQHHRWSGKNCPSRIRAEGRWEWLLGEVAKELGMTGDRRYFPETGHWLAGGFKAFWEQHGGLPVFGYPLSEEYRGPAIAGCGCRDDGQPHVVQWFERARFEWHPGRAPERHDVLLGRVGAELAEKLGLLSSEPFRRREG